MKIYLKKSLTWSRVMKSTLSQGAIALLFTGMTFAKDTNAQAILDRKVTISINDKLDVVLNALKENAKVKFVYSKDVIKIDQQVSLNVNNQKLGVVLDKLLNVNGISYETIDNRIVLGKSAEKTVDATSLKPAIEIAQVKVSGQVTDSNGEPLIGVGVQLKGAKNVTSTDVNGRYTLNLPDGDGILIFTYIGYVTREIPVNNQSTINVSLTEDSKSLEEVVVVGYGTQKKVNLTGSVDVISGEQLENRPASKVADLLKGTSPNLNISMNSRGGEPGAASNFNIRGVGSINLDATRGVSTSPLVLVDGVEMDINNVDPESIESVSVLKDASASAIYGSKAPFGVILITTKKGSKDGKVNVQYNNTLSLASPVRPLSQVDALTWATAYNQANANALVSTPIYSDEQMNRIRDYMAGTYPYEYDPNNPISGIFLGRRNGNANYDWASLMFKNNTFNQKHNINVSGGTDKTQFYIAGGFTDQDGMYNYGYDFYKRYNFLTNLSTRVTNWLSLNTSLKYAKGYSDYPLGITTVGRDHAFGEFLTWAPMTPMYNINGTIQNPLIRMMEDGGRDKLEINDFLLVLGGEFEPVKGWKTNVSYNHNVQTDRRMVNPKPVMVELGNGAFGNIGKPSATYQSVYSQPLYTLFNVVSSYEKQVNNHYFKGLLGYEQDKKTFSSLNATASGLITPEVPSISTAVGNKTVEDDLWHWTTQGVFGRLNYNFKEKYLVEFSARYNGSSRFAENLRWGFFPSGSVGYNISKENFWEPVKPYVNMLKLRGSYGSLGNQNVYDYFQYIKRIDPVAELNWIIDGQRPPYANVPKIISPTITWETVSTLNIGLDAEFLKNRLGLAFDWYNRRTDDMMTRGEDLPYLLGTIAPNVNNASLTTKGFELALSWNQRISSDFAYNARITLGDSRTTVLKFNNEKGVIDNYYVGKEVGEIWGYVTDGLIQTQGEAMYNQTFFYSTWGPGDMKYKNLDGDRYLDTNGNPIINDGTRTLDDHGDLTVIGNTSPRYNYSFTGGVNWKSFDFNMFWQGVGKHDYYPHTNAGMFYGMLTAFGSSTILKDSPALDYWRPANETNILGPNTNAYFAKPYFTAQTNKNRQVQSRYVLNGAYLRLKNISVGYTIPQKLSNKLFLQKARIYVAGENLLTFTGLPKVYDPETVFAENTGNAPQATYPVSRYWIMGFNLTF